MNNYDYKNCSIAFWGEPDIELINLPLVNEENCILYPNLRTKTETEKLVISKHLRLRLQTLSKQFQRLEEIALKFKTDFIKIKIYIFSLCKARIWSLFLKMYRGQK